MGIVKINKLVSVSVEVKTPSNNGSQNNGNDELEKKYGTYTRQLRD